MDQQDEETFASIARNLRDQMEWVGDTQRHDHLRGLKWGRFEAGQFLLAAALLGAGALTVAAFGLVHPVAGVGVFVVAVLGADRLPR